MNELGIVGPDPQNPLANISVEDMCHELTRRMALAMFMDDTVGPGPYGALRKLRRKIDQYDAWSDIDG